MKHVIFKNSHLLKDHMSNLYGAKSDKDSLHLSSQVRDASRDDDLRQTEDDQ